MEKEKNNYSTNEKTKIEIDVNKYKHLVEALNSPKMLAKIITVFAVLITLIFFGISAVALVVKEFYPYKAVETNKYGATVIKNEDSEVTYWLFNSADLWANSGIEVKKGQRITVRTSGAANTAIHHLVQDAEENRMLRDQWFSPTGINKQYNESHSARSNYRIANNYPQNEILMQVLSKETIESINNIKERKSKSIDDKIFDYIDGGIGKNTIANIYAIGEQYENIEIQNDGFLCFACNDIALTPRVIDSMLVYKDKLGIKPHDSTKTELEYYKELGFIDAWFVDNVGSFLVVVERLNR